MRAGSTTHPVPGRTRFAAVVAVLVVVLLVACLLSLAVGARPIPLATVVDAVLGHGSSPDHAVVRDSRLPRTLVGLLAGAALGVAGALMQAVTRNPLAEPGLLGVNAGAAFAVIVSVGLVGDRGPAVSVWFALLGAVLAAVLVWVVGGGGRKAADPARLALAGIALGAVLFGVGQGLALTDPRAFDRLRAWQLGSIDVRSMAPVVATWPFVVVGLVLALSLGRSLNVVALGDDLARAVGARVGLVRGLAVVAVTLLAGAATSAVGAIGFLGLMVPHAARRLVGRDQRKVLLTSMLGAPALLLLADVAGRKVVAGELPVGVAMAFLGGPVLVAIARGRKVHAL